MSDKHYSTGHLAALRRFALAITVLTILGHAFLGFEQSIAQPLVALATAYAMQIVLEVADTWSEGHQPRFAGGPLSLMNFLLSAPFTALAIAMLLYFNDPLWVVAFATAVAIGSETLLRAPIGRGTRHFLNPSNFGITVTRLLFPWVGLVPPWQFTANLFGAADWVLPALILVLGSYLNFRYTRRGPLIVAWLVSFILQAVLRAVLGRTSLLPSIVPATGVAALLFTFYMAPDPATTPESFGGQILFGASIAAVYAILVSLHVAFGFFYALAIVCAMRGLALYAMRFTAGRRRQSAPIATTASAG